MKGKVFVTGATGLLGVNTVIELIRNGYDVRTYVRPQSNHSLLREIPCELYFGHLDDATALNEAMAGCDYVIHAASVTVQWGLAYKEYENINIKSTEYLIEACLQQNIKRMIYIGTANCIGPGNRLQPATELESFTLFKINSPYINTKYIALQKIKEAVMQRQLPAIIVHPTFMIGAYDSKPSSGQLLLYALKNPILFYPVGTKNFISVSDVSKIITHTIERGVVGESYLAASSNMTYKNFFLLVHRVANKNVFMIKIPALILKFAGACGSFLGFILKKRFKLNYGTAHLLCSENYYDGSKAEKELQIEYSSIQTAVKEALEWFELNRNEN